MSTPVPTPPAPEQWRTMRRPRAGRRIAGVCAGLAEHLGVPVRRVRVVMILLGLAGGAGFALYLWLWITVPSGEALRQPALARIAPTLRKRERRIPVTDIAVGLLLLCLAGLLIAWRAGWEVSASWVLPALILVGGLALAWSQLDLPESWRSRASEGRTPISVLRVLGALILVMVGVMLLVGRGQDPSVLVRATVAAVAMLAGVLLALAPWWLRLVQALGDERAAHARESERADIAAHLHDSVLQTLAIIRSRSNEPETVARLARAQERELRKWLYSDRAEAGTSLTTELRDLVADIEDAHGREIQFVAVGDCVPTPQLQAMANAAREAVLNAVRHTSGPVSIYVEVDTDVVEVFVRDRGDGFDLDAVPSDRLGVRESIIGRMERNGGKASIRTGPESGTEVRLSMARGAEQS